MDAAPTAFEYVESLGVSHRDVAERAAELRRVVEAEIDDVLAATTGGASAFPEVEMAEVLAGSVAPSLVESIRRRGCAVVRGTFDRGQAEAWDAAITDYLDRNSFRERFERANPEVATGSRIWPIYWSPAQVEARRHERMNTVRSFLNRVWRFEGGSGRRWFDPDTDVGYVDRLRRREPGAVSRGLSCHIDAPLAAGWRLEENRRVLAPLLTGGVDAYDPWDAEHRVTPVSGARADWSSACTVFRTFQGWTALSEVWPEDGVLHVVPVPVAVAYRTVAGLAGELGVGVDVATPAPLRDAGDDLVERGLVPIPAVAPGDTVWWHGDLFHSVAAASNTERSSNVMYIGAAPMCARNAPYGALRDDRFRRGVSPPDFPQEDLEVDFEGRALWISTRAQGGQ